mmetsp:Transcript_13062/g.29067  ORF Transcript_13062/g.29067 Transcript_13062/m.29067 type:complete len:98 (-) Transcript_13062:211-504(-)
MLGIARCSMGSSRRARTSKAAPLTLYLFARASVSSLLKTSFSGTSAAAADEEEEEEEEEEQEEKKEEEDEEEDGEGMQALGTTSPILDCKNRVIFGW